MTVQKVVLGTTLNATEKRKIHLNTRKRFHRLAIPQLIGLWQAWEDAGLIDRINTFLRTCLASG